MKKNLLIMVLLIVAGVLIITAYNSNKKLTTARAEAESLSLELALSEESVKGLEAAMLSLKEKLSLAETELDISKTALQESQDQLQAIDQQLRGEGSISDKIQALEDENDQWREQLNALSIDLNELQALEQEDSGLSQEENIVALEAVQEAIANRMQVLTEAVSGLSKLSLERIMVEQEVKFLEGIMIDVKSVEDRLRDGQ